MNTSTEKSKSHDTEQAILRAAEHEFLTKGFDGARTTTIAEAAGVTHAMLHYYFRTKGNIFSRILSEKMELLKDVLFSSVDNMNLPLEETIRIIVDRHLDFLSQNPDLPRFVIGEISNGSGRMDDVTDQIKKIAPKMFSGLQAKIDAAVAEGRCRKVDAAMLILDIASLNIFSFIMTPVIKSIFDCNAINGEKFITMRKKENFETLMRKLLP